MLRIAGAKPIEKFGEYKGVQIGYLGELNGLVDLSELMGRFSSFEIKALLFGKDKVKRIAAVSGRGGFAIKEAVEKGVDLFITGEAEHELYHIAREGRINVFFLGHYSSECIGIKALMEVVRNKLGVETAFIDIPTGL